MHIHTGGSRSSGSSCLFCPRRSTLWGCMLCAGCVSALECPYVLEFCRKLYDMGIVPPRGLELVVGECSRLLEEKRLEDSCKMWERGEESTQPDLVYRNVRKNAQCCHGPQICPDLLLSYNVIMQKFRDQGDLHSVLNVFGVLRLAGANPDTYTYCILIDACGRCGEAAKATVVFEGLLKAGAVLNVYVYNSIMNVHANNIQHVLQLFKQMRSAGVAADLITYNIVLKSCSLCRNPGVALSLYKELEEKRASGKIEMNVFTYSTLIQIFGEAKILLRLRMRWSWLELLLTLSLGPPSMELSLKQVWWTRHCRCFRIC